MLTVRDEQEAISVAERMRKACSSNSTATVSIVVSVFRSLDTPAEVLERADRALNETKRAGRDGMTLQH